MKLERKADDQEIQLKTQETDLQTAASVKAELEAKLKASDEQCALWRSKARHRHRALEMPKFGDAKSEKQKREQWLQERALAESLGFDSDNNKSVTVTLDSPPPVGLGLLNAKDHASGEFCTVIHTIKEVNSLLWHLSCRMCL